jgi:hypothetical protein
MVEEGVSRMPPSSSEISLPAATDNIWILNPNSNFIMLFSMHPA